MPTSFHSGRTPESGSTWDEADPQWLHVRNRFLKHAREVLGFSKYCALYLSNCVVLTQSAHGTVAQRLEPPPQKGKKTKEQDATPASGPKAKPAAVDKTSKAGKAPNAGSSSTAPNPVKKVTKPAAKPLTAKARQVRKKAVDEAPQKPKGSTGGIEVLEIEDSDDEPGWDENSEDEGDAPEEKVVRKADSGRRTALEVPSEDEEEGDMDVDTGEGNVDLDLDAEVDEDMDVDVDADEREEEEDEDAHTHKQRGKLPERASQGRLTPLTSTQASLSKIAATGTADGGKAKGKGKAVVLPSTKGYVFLPLHLVSLTILPR